MKMEYITFGRFGREEYWKKDREIFLDELRRLVSELAKNKDLYEKANENELAKSLKPLFKKKFFNHSIKYYLGDFMRHMGLSYDILTSKEKEEIKEMEFTYENWEKKSEELYNNYLMRCKKNCPETIYFCLDYRMFINSVQGGYQCELTLNNFLRFIRDFFILEKDLSIYEKYIDREEFDKIRNKVIDIYPKLKETYGPNRTLEKNFLFLFDEYNDYNYEIVANILDNYYDKKKKKNIKINDDEKIKLKDN